MRVSPDTPSTVTASTLRACTSRPAQLRICAIGRLLLCGCGRRAGCHPHGYITPHDRVGGPADNYHHDRTTTSIGSTETTSTPVQRDPTDGLGKPVEVPRHGWRHRVRSKPGLRETYRVGV